MAFYKHNLPQMTRPCNCSFANASNDATRSAHQAQLVLLLWREMLLLWCPTFFSHAMGSLESAR